MKGNLLEKIRCFAGAAAVLLAAGGAARADVVYNNQAAWNANVSGVTTVNFEAIVPVNGFQAYPGTTTVGGVNFSIGPASPAGLLFVIGDNFYGFGVATVSSQDPGTGINPTNDLLITLPNPATAVALDFIVDPGTVTVQLSDGLSQQLTAANAPSSLFFGVTAPGGITSVDISEPYSLGAQSINLSDVSYATAATATPEPSSYAFFSVALAAGLVWMRRKRPAPSGRG